MQQIEDSQENSGDEEESGEEEKGAAKKKTKKGIKKLDIEQTLMIMIG